MIDLVGQRFNRLLVLSFSHKIGHKTYWMCKCDCGKTVSARSDSMKIGRIKSCGCYISEIKRISTKKHGFYKRPEYKAWVGIKDRCYNKNNSQYHNYGGRGIAICEKWRTDFQSFFNDVGARPTRKHSIDRINNDGNYEPGNCKWSTWIQQQSNRSNNKRIEHKGVTMILAEWARHIGVSQSWLSAQLKTKTINQIIESKKHVQYG